MKRVLALALICGLLISVVGCGQEEVSEAKQEETVIEEATEEEPEVQQEEEFKSLDVDLDLTELTSTMIYSEVYNMMMDPESYVGSTVKISGISNIYEDPNTGNVYYSCIVKDATQCCAQGLEYVLDPEKYSKEDYPPFEEEITVSGTFATYEEQGRQYLTILNAELE